MRQAEIAKNSLNRYFGVQLGDLGRSKSSTLVPPESSLAVLVIPRLHDEAGSTSWLVERSTSWLDELAIWSFEWCNIANIHEAARRALDERSTSQLVEAARRASFIV